MRHTLYKYGPGPGNDPFRLRSPEEILKSKEKYYLVPRAEVEICKNLKEVNEKLQKLLSPGKFIVIKGKVLKIKTVAVAEDEEVELPFEIQPPDAFIRYGSGPRGEKGAFRKAIKEFKEKSRPPLSKIPLGGIKYGAGFLDQSAPEEKKERTLYFIVPIEKIEACQDIEDVNRRIQQRQVGEFIIIKGRILKIKTTAIIEEEDRG